MTRYRERPRHGATDRTGQDSRRGTSTDRCQPRGKSAAGIRPGDRVVRRDAPGEWSVAGIGETYYSRPHRGWRREVLVQSDADPGVREWTDLHNCRST